MASVVTGARAIVYLGEQRVLYASGVTITQEMRLEEIPQLDSLLVAEYAESGHRVSFTVNTFKEVTINASNTGGLADLFPLIDNPDPKNTLLQPELIFLILDSVTGNPIYEVTGAKFESGSGTLNARGLWEGSWSFRGRRGRGI